MLSLWLWGWQSTNSCSRIFLSFYSWWYDILANLQKTFLRSSPFFFYFFLFLATLFDFAYFFGLFFLPNLIDQCNYTRIQTPPCLSLDLLHYRLSFYSYPLFLAGKFIHEVSTSLYVRTFVSICLLISFLSYLSSHQHINKCINLVLNEMQSFFLSQLTFWWILCTRGSIF